MNRFSSLRVRLVGIVFLAMSPAWVLMYLGYLPWAALIPGLLALAAAWYGGERFINRQVRRLSIATQRLATGDLTSRTGRSGGTGLPTAPSPAAAADDGLWSAHGGGASGRGEWSGLASGGTCTTSWVPSR